MENTLQVGDRVLVNKVVYHFRGIARGDVIVFSGQDSWGPDAPPPSSDPVVRIFDDVLSGIGLQNNQTYYIKRVIGLPGDHVACCTDGKVTVNGVPLSEGSYVYPGNPPSSVKFSEVVPAGHLWVMGDHRSDSEDSRYNTGDPGGGAIPENQVVGRAFLIIWPPSQIRDLPIPSTFQQAALSAAGGRAGGRSRRRWCHRGPATPAAPTQERGAVRKGIGAPIGALSGAEIRFPPLVARLIPAVRPVRGCRSGDQARALSSTVCAIGRGADEWRWPWRDAGGRAGGRLGRKRDATRSMTRASR